jgi:hypothetical protein
MASFYAGVVRAQTIGGPKTASDPITQFIMRLARKAIVSRPEAAAASRQIGRAVWCIRQHTHTTTDPHFMRSYRVRNICAKLMIS